MKIVVAAAFVLTGCLINTDFSVDRYKECVSWEYVFGSEVCTKYEVEFECRKLTPLLHHNATIARCKTAEECETKCNAARSEREKGRK